MSNIPPPLPPAPPPPSFVPPPLPESPAQSEIVRLVLDNLDQKTGIFSKQTFRLLVTDRRLIFALQQKNGIDYLKRDPSLALAENPVNFEIPLDGLERIETYHAVMDDNSPDSMVVKAIGQKLSFNIRNYFKVQKQLKEVLGSRVV